MTAIDPTTCYSVHYSINYCAACGAHQSHDTGGCLGCRYRTVAAPAADATYDEIETRWAALRASVEDDTAKRIAAWLYARQLLDNETLTAIKRGDWRKP